MTAPVPPTAEAVRDLLARGEGPEIEIKAVLPSPREVARNVAAFANTRGGFLIVGVEENGRVRGVERQAFRDVVAQAGRLLTPPQAVTASFVSLDGGDVAVVGISPSRSGPVLVEDIPLIRVGSTVRAADAPALVGLANVVPRDEDRLRSLAVVVETQTQAIEQLRSELRESAKLRKKLPELLLGGAIGAILGFLLSLLLGVPPS